MINSGMTMTKDRIKPPKAIIKPCHRFTDTVSFGSIPGAKRERRNLAGIFKIKYAKKCPYSMNQKENRHYKHHKREIQ